MGRRQCVFAPPQRRTYSAPPSLLKRSAMDKGRRSAQVSFGPHCHQCCREDPLAGALVPHLACPALHQHQFGQQRLRTWNTVRVVLHPAEFSLQIMFRSPVLSLGSAVLPCAALPSARPVPQPNFGRDHVAGACSCRCGPDEARVPPAVPRPRRPYWKRCLQWRRPGGLCCKVCGRR